RAANAAGCGVAGKSRACGRAAEPCRRCAGRDGTCAEVAAASHGAGTKTGTASGRASTEAATTTHAHTTGAATTAAAFNLRKARARHGDGQRHGRGHTQHFQTVHFWLHFRDAYQPPTGGDVPEPCTTCA